VRVRRIVSGGQTGADRGGLDAALALGLEHGGWCPRGRRSEDGKIPERYLLRETDAGDYSARTEKNVVESDGTILFSRGTPTGGSALTAAMARKHARPLLHVDLSACADPVQRVRQWLEENDIEIVNVAGPRASNAPGIAEEVKELLIAALQRSLG
jgi:hypothetical protein